ncbi:MAG: hypothetical protein KDA28_05640, partial [Phycisphaerales bacterium]|nr:hypothetical protein [Phycisphaerales bacterium]
VMGLPGLKKIREHKAINRRIDAWMAEHPVAVHVPVDSPAANFPICAMARRRGVRIVHLVAPQIWAWGTWRIRKLRRLTDLVLCILPFEEGWFNTHGVPARFIGHPLFDETPRPADLLAHGAGLPDGTPRIALLPGSRPGELARNFPLLLRSFRALKAARPGLSGVVAATTPAVEQRLRAMAEEHGGWPDGLEMASGATDAIIHWCDLAIVVSGTVTLQIARQRRPMVIVYTSNRIGYHLLARWLLTTKFFALPNLIAGREIVPEFIPHFGGHEAIVERVASILDDERAIEDQRAALDRVVEKFQGFNAARAAADAIEEMADLSRRDRGAEEPDRDPPVPTSVGDRYPLDQGSV